MRLQADADPARWVPVTGSFGLRGRRHRKRAIGMLLAQANAALGATPRPGAGRGVAAWAMSQAVPMLLRRADGACSSGCGRTTPSSSSHSHRCSRRPRSCAPRAR